MTGLSRLGLAPVRRGVSTPVTPGASFITPENYDFLGFGDSRTENSFGAALNTNGYTASSNNYGPWSWLPELSGQRLRYGRYPNFGISASKLSQGALIPRKSAVDTLVDSTPKTWYRGGDSVNKGADYAAAHPAGIVFILYGVNDLDSDLPVIARNNLLAIINNLRNTQLKVILNETGTGLACDGTSLGSVSQNKKDFAAWIKTLSGDSGHANARPDVLVVDSFGATYNSATNQNYQGLLRDDRHFTPWGSKQIAQLTIDRIAAAIPGYNALPQRITWPTVGQNGLTTPALAAPFVHTNPGMFLNGANGQVVGTNFGTAPLASGIVPGFSISGSGSFAGISVVADRSEVDPDGYTVQKLVITGTLADGLSYGVDFYSIALAAGQFALTDKIKGICMRKVDAGSNCFLGANLNIRAMSSTPALTQRANEGGGSSGGGTDRRGYAYNSNGYDAGGNWAAAQTQLLDLADPNMDVANGGPGVFANQQSVGVYLSLGWANFTGSTQTIDTTVRVSRLAMIRQNAS